MFSLLSVLKQDGEFSAGCLCKACLLICSGKYFNNASSNQPQTMTCFFIQSPAVKDILKDQESRKGLIAAICAGGLTRHLAL